MNNRNPMGPLDEASLPDGDLQFVGVEERTVFASAGFVNQARNCRFRYGKAATRDGITILPWGLGNGLQPFPSVLGGFVFADPNGVDEYILIATTSGVFYTRPNQPARAVPLPAGVSLSRSTFRRFVQANASIILLRGFSDDGSKLRPLQLTKNSDGEPDFVTGFQAIQQENIFDATLEAVAVTNGSGGSSVVSTNKVTLVQHNLSVGDPVTFAAAVNGVALPVTIVAGTVYYVLDTPNGDQFTIAATPEGSQVTWVTLGQGVRVTVLDGAYPIPEAKEGIFKQNRLFLIDGKDTAAVSDIGDFTRYVPTQSEFRINQGDAYTLDYLYLFNEDTLLCFKNGSVSKVTGMTGDLSGATGPLNVTQAYGIAAPSVADIGTDVYWLNSELRVTSLSLTELNKEQGTDNALSDPLLRTFGRISPQWAGASRLTVFDGYLLVALPLDDAQLVDGVNVLPAGAAYNQPYPIPVPSFSLSFLTAGQAYLWEAGSADQVILQPNGAGASFVKGDSVFVASGFDVLLATAGTAAGTPIGSQFFKVLAQGCNTGVAVYDFLQKAWCGTDEGQATCVVDWLKFTYNGKQQLAFIGADGYLHLYADGYEDEVVAAADVYVDLFLDPQISFAYNSAIPGVGTDTIRVNGGTLVQGAISPTNAGTNWGTNQAAPGGNLWQDANGVGGYNPAASNHWLCPNCTAVQVADGVRFVPTNGALPTIEINGVAVGTTTGMVAALNSWTTFYFDWHGPGNSIQPVPIDTWFKSRAYPCKSWQSYALIYTTGGRMDFKRYTGVKLHLEAWDPSYTISTLSQDENDLNAVREDQTRDYLSYFAPVDRPQWVPDNSNDDFHAPGREDYSYPELGPGLFLQGDGVNFDQLQKFTSTVPLSERGIYVQLVVENTQGHLELAGVELEAQTGDELSGDFVKA